MTGCKRGKVGVGAREEEEAGWVSRQSPGESAVCEHLRRAGSRYSWHESQGPHMNRRECFNPLDMAEEWRKVQSESWPLAAGPGAVAGSGGPSQGCWCGMQGGHVRVRKQSQHPQAP